jgi:hypothetical protein
MLKYLYRDRAACDPSQVACRQRVIRESLLDCPYCFLPDRENPASPHLVESKLITNENSLVTRLSIKMPRFELSSALPDTFIASGNLLTNQCSSG